MLKLIGALNRKLFINILFAYQFIRSSWNVSLADENYTQNTTRSNGWTHVLSMSAKSNIACENAVCDLLAAEYIYVTMY